MSRAGRWFRLGVSALVLVAAGACGEDEIEFPEPLVRVDVGVGDCGNLRVDETCQLQARVFDLTGEEVDDVLLDWTSRNPVFAVVTFEGEVTAIMAGQATIVAQTPGGALADSVTVTITEEPSEGPPL